MRRFFCLLCALTLLCLPLCRAEEDSFVVVEDDVSLPPDPRRQARALMSRMSREEMVYQLFFVTLEDLTKETYTTVLPEKNLFAQYPVGGVALYGQNIVSEAQLKALTDGMRRQAAAARAYPLFIGVHEAGGSISRVANKLGYDQAPGPEEIGIQDEETLARQAGERVAKYLTPLGINLNFAAPLDTVVLDENGVGERSYGGDPRRVSDLAATMADALGQAGMICCQGHFPNDGSLSKRNYYGVASCRRTLDEMAAWEWLPFMDAVNGGADMIMMSNGTVRSVGDDMPASLSRQMIGGALRTYLGYDGVVITESLRMTCVTASYKPGKAAVLALQAGADMLFLSEDFQAASQAVFKALDTGELTLDRIEESVERILALKILSGLIR